MRNEYNNRLRFYPAHCHSRLNLFCRAGQEREKSTQYTVIHCVTSYEKGQVLSPALSCLQKILHCLIYPGIFEIVEQKKRLPEGNLFMERKTRLELATPTLARFAAPRSKKAPPFQTYQLSYFRRSDYQRVIEDISIYTRHTDKRRKHTDTAWVSIWVSVSDIDCNE